MSEPTAEMFVFAGNNGSGKSTIRNLIIDRLGISVNIDPDSLTRRIDNENPERHRVSAGKEAIKLVRECIKNKRDFSIETTLAGVIVLEADFNHSVIKYMAETIPNWVKTIEQQLHNEIDNDE
ncbi:hypothetical protein BK133_27525 [Paenibacillus sp. FSL H8-0548]|nr:hypothetical protein BK133_27525 [Paenibacillus sp. FSL H8-0548]